jgi:phosphate transport system permease protein
MRKRRLKQKLFIALTAVSALITASLLILILGVIFMKGASALSLKYILTPENETPGFNQGIGNAILGTIILALSSVMLAIPLAISIAIYLSEYAKKGKFTSLLRFFIDLLAGMPSIILGIIGFIIFVISMRTLTGGFSLIAGSAALAILVFPTMARTAEEALKTVPRNIKEASYALGSTKWEVIKNICVPYALPGIITGVVLGVGRAAEESAIVALTAGYSQFMPRFDLIHFTGKGLFMDTKIVPLQEGIASLPIAVYHSFEFANMVPRENGFATATVLIVIVMCINLSAKFISRKYRIG